MQRYSGGNALWLGVIHLVSVSGMQTAEAGPFTGQETCSLLQTHTHTHTNTNTNTHTYARSPHYCGPRLKTHSTSNTFYWVFNEIFILMEILNFKNGTYFRGHRHVIHTSRQKMMVVGWKSQLAGALLIQSGAVKQNYVKFSNQS